MLSKIQELTEKKNKDVKFLIIPYILYYIHKGATSFRQVRIGQKFFFLISSTSSPVLFAGST